jgi:hypothetical protein
MKFLTLIKDLPDKKIKEIMDYASFLKWQEKMGKRSEEEKATLEILKDKKLLKSLNKGLKDLKEGRLFKWGNIKRSVRNPSH